MVEAPYEEIREYTLTVPDYQSNWRGHGGPRTIRTPRKSVPPRKRSITFTVGGSSSKRAKTDPIRDDVPSIHERGEPSHAPPVSPHPQATSIGPVPSVADLEADRIREIRETRQALESVRGQVETLTSRVHQLEQLRIDGDVRLQQLTHRVDTMQIGMGVHNTRIAELEFYLGQMEHSLMLSVQRADGLEHLATVANMRATVAEARQASSEHRIGILEQRVNELQEVLIDMGHLVLFFTDL